MREPVRTSAPATQHVECPACEAAVGSPCVWKKIPTGPSHGARTMITMGGISNTELNAELNERLLAGELGTLPEGDVARTEYLKDITVKLVREWADVAKAHPISTSEVFEPQVKFVCPFCGLLCAAGAADGTVPGVLHEAPTCSTFDAIEDPADFLAAVRKALPSVPLA